MRTWKNVAGQECAVEIAFGSIRAVRDDLKIDLWEGFEGKLDPVGKLSLAELASMLYMLSADVPGKRYRGTPEQFGRNLASPEALSSALVAFWTDFTEFVYKNAAAVLKILAHRAGRRADDPVFRAEVVRNLSRGVMHALAAEEK